MRTEKIEVRTTVAMSRELAQRFRAEAEINRRGWTNEIVILAEEALADRRVRREKATAAPQ